MKRHRLITIIPTILALVAVWATPLLASVASAQETGDVKEKRVVVEVRDGKVFVNGEEAEVGEEGHIILRKGDDDEIVIVKRPGGAYWFSSGFGDAWTHAEEARENAEAAHELARGLYRMRRPDMDDEDFDFDVEVAAPRNFDVLFDGRLADAFDNAGIARSGLFRMRAESRELRELESRIRAKTREIRRAEEAERSALEAELDALVSDAFAMKMEAEKKGIAELEERLAELQHRLQERQAQRQEIIQRRKKELLGRRDNLDW